MTALGDATSELFDDLAAEAGVSVTVTRGTDTPKTLTAIKGRSFTERFGDEGMYGTSLESDFIFKVAEYTAQVGGPPQRNDFIQWTDDAGTTRKHQVGVDGVERHYDPVGQFGLLWRVHSTEVNV